MNLTDSGDAQYEASRNHPSAKNFLPIINDGHLIGWTFQAARNSYGWILTDGRTSPAYEPYRSYARDYASNSIGAAT